MRMKTLTTIAKYVRIRGIVQGVGFRPFVYRLAQRYGVAGGVCNRRGDVEVTVQGLPDAVDAFLRDLREDAPAAADVRQVTIRRIAPSDLSEFVIGESGTGRRGAIPISPDIATCADCLRELFDPNDRRFRYPLIACAHCGPRYTIVKSPAYDRDRTSMAQFAMCEACHGEYIAPADRRFHAQAIACPKCGPSVAFVDFDGTPVASGDPIAAAADRLRAGWILAVKGLGGYHLAVDATNEQAVAELRRRKHRERKPFAVMARTLPDLSGRCALSLHERHLLVSPRSPIVLVRRWERTGIASGVTSGLPDLGVTLAYTPLHHLLLKDLEDQIGRPALLVMTSGNRSDEPIACDDAEALLNLGKIADGFLIHNRDIINRCDDTVTRCVGDSEMVIRRSRGSVPAAFETHFPFRETVLACGAHQKNTVCLGTGRSAILGSHVGDLETFESLQSFERSIETLIRLTGTRPRIIAHDLHPDYLSTKYALDLDEVRTIGVQHHHAHIASVLAEHGIEGPVIGVAFDGTGFGTDGRIWGGEFLIADRGGFARAAHLDYIQLPGAKQAIRQPWRMGAVYLQRAFGKDFPALDLPFVRDLDPAEWHPVNRMIERGLNCPLTSSMGRLFDAVAAIVLRHKAVSFEGQAAMELEAVADDNIVDGYKFTIQCGEPTIIDPLPVVRGIVNDLRSSVAQEIVAGRFHAAVARMIVTVCEALRSRHRLDEVALSGGVFQNRLLTDLTLRLLEDAGFTTFTNNRIPVNDGGIAFGQAAVAAAKMET